MFLERLALLLDSSWYQEMVPAIKNIPTNGINNK